MQTDAWAERQEEGQELPVRKKGYGESSIPWESLQHPAGLSHAFNSAPAPCLYV